MAYDIRISSGVVNGQHYSENWESNVALTRREALAYLRRLTHEPYIGGTGRTVTLCGPRGGHVTLGGCKSDTRQGCRVCKHNRLLIGLDA